MRTKWQAALVVAVLLISVAGCALEPIEPEMGPDLSEASLSVHVMDVGQADAI